eukprot:13452862-Alexandrium_andersonii.AAC.1
MSPSSPLNSRDLRLQRALEAPIAGFRGWGSPVRSRLSDTAHSCAQHYCTCLGGDSGASGSHC